MAVMTLPVVLDRNLTPDVANKNDQNMLLRNCIAAGLSVSWFYSLAEDYIVVRVSADEARLHLEAERIGLNMRESVNFAMDMVQHRPPMECFNPYRCGRDEWYTNAFSAHVVNGKYSFSSLERARIVHSIMFASIDENGANLTPYLQRGRIGDIFPMHDPRELGILTRKWFDRRWYGLTQFAQLPQSEIRDYFGEQMALYCLYVGFYTQWLFVPACVGFIVSMIQFFYSMDSIITPLFSIFIAFWSTLFIEAWKRRESELTCAWHVEGYEQIETYRPEYEGHKALNQITGELEVIYPTWKRCVSFALSYSVLLVLLVCVFVLMSSIIILRVLLASNSTGGALACAGITFLQIQIANFFYAKVAAKMTDWENHRFPTQYNDALIAKSFLFQFFNSYASFFYMAFAANNSEVMGVGNQCWNNDCMAALSLQLGVIFILHTIIQQISELFIPYCERHWARWIKEWKMWWRVCCRKHDVEEMQALSQASHLYTDEEVNHLKPEYETTIDDFSELMIQFGFMTLFAPAFPLGFTIGYVNNLIEIRSDGFKVCTLCRRPLYHCAEDIGTWEYVLNVMSIASVVTNAALIAFTSGSLNRYTEGLGDSDQWTVKLLIAFGVEHLVLSLKFAIEFLIDDEPDWVKDTKRRRAYHMEQRHQESAQQVWHRLGEDGSSAYDEYLARLQTRPVIEWHVDTVLQ